jgi:serine/threonine protein kinase
MPLAAGARLGPYEIVALLGQGGMGEVYRARDPRLGRDVAIKTSRDQFNERFEREALGRCGAESSECLPFVRILPSRAREQAVVKRREVPGMPFLRRKVAIVGDFITAS